MLLRAMQSNTREIFSVFKARHLYNLMFHYLYYISDYQKYLKFRYNHYHT